MEKFHLKEVEIWNLWILIAQLQVRCDLGLWNVKMLRALLITHLLFYQWVGALAQCL